MLNIRKCLIRVYFLTNVDPKLDWSSNNPWKLRELNRKIPFCKFKDNSRTLEDEHRLETAATRGRTWPATWPLDPACRVILQEQILVPYLAHSRGVMILALDQNQESEHQSSRVPDPDSDPVISGIITSTGRMGWMAHQKWKEAKELPGTAGPGNMLGCSLFLSISCGPSTPSAL